MIHSSLNPNTHLLVLDEASPMLSARKYVLKSITWIAEKAHPIPSGKKSAGK